MVDFNAYNTYPDRKTVVILRRDARRLQTAARLAGVSGFEVVPYGEDTAGLFPDRATRRDAAVLSNYGPEAVAYFVREASADADVQAAIDKEDRAGVTDPDELKLSRG